MPARSSQRSTARRAATPPATAPAAGVVFMTRQVHFNAAHRLYNPARSRAWNLRQYGKCTSPHWHGHNYVLEVTVKGAPDPATGYVMNLQALKRILEAAVVEPCYHHNLNEEVAFLRGIIPTTENLVIAFWRQIEPAIKRGRLHRVRLYETPRNFADFYGFGGD